VFTDKKTVPDSQQQAPALFDHIPRGVPGKSKHGQALPETNWADPEDILSIKDPKNVSPAYIHGDGKFLLGMMNDEVIGIDDDRHVFLCAGSRSGKGRSIIVPNLLHYEGSVIAIDPKAELANLTARRRGKGRAGQYEGMGQKIIILDPFGKTNDYLAEYKKSYNPLSTLSLESETLIEDIGLIADALVISREDERDPHWNETAKTLLETIILHVVTDAYYEGKRTLFTVRKLLIRGTVFEVPVTEKPGEMKTYKGERGLKKEIEDNVEELRKTHPDYADILEGGMMDYFEKEDKERMSVKSTARRHTKFLDYPALQNVLKHTDPENSFDLKELKTAPEGATIYLCLPTSRLASCSRWFRLMTALCVESMERCTAKIEKPVLMCLDEFPVLGHLKVLESAAGYMAGFGVKLLTVIQDLSQLKRDYRNSWETFLGNAGIWIFFGNNDLTTLEFIQKRCGKTTLRKDSLRQTDHKQRLSGATGESWSTEVVDLITPEEASRIFGRGDIHKRQLVIHGGAHNKVPPMIVSRMNYDESPYFEEKQPDGQYTKIYDPEGF